MPEGSCADTIRDRLGSATHAERAALADDLAHDLATLDDTQWTRPSLCGRWGIEEVDAHLTAAANSGPLRWFASVFGACFDFDLHNDRRLAENLSVTPAQTLMLFGSTSTSTKSECVV